MRHWLLFFLVSFTCCLITPLFAQENDTTSGIFHPQVKELLNLSVRKIKDEEVSIAGRFSQTQEQAPAIVSVITKDDIKLWGARDVSDILRQVAGFEFGIDVQSLFGVGFRGLWGHEGKVLLMIDNKIVNCFGYGNTNFFGTYPAAMIERVEIIRGPGSAIYGGFAEVAVINIITPRGSQYNGIQFNTATGLMGSNGLTFNANGGGGFKKNDLEMSVQGGYNYTPTSTELYRDFSGGTLQMGNDLSWRQWQHLVAKLQYKTFALSYNFNQTSYLAQTQFGPVLPLVNGNPMNNLFHYTETLQGSYTKDFKSGLSAEVLLDLTRGNPITSRVNTQIDKTPQGQFVLPDASTMWENTAAKGYRGKIETYLTYDHHKIGRLMVGGGYQLDAANSIQLDGYPGFQFSKNQADTSYWVTNPARYGFFQYNIQIKNFGLTLGSRYETNRFGSAFAPRVGLTYVAKSLNMKLLYGRAFRVPLLWQAYSRQYNSSQNVLQPELADTFEFEIGYKFTPDFVAKVNLYVVNIDKPITYIGGNNSYQNFGEAASRGVEGEITYKKPIVGGFLNFAYNVASPITSTIFTAADRQAFLGLPTTKINAGGYYKLKKWSFAPSCTFIGSRYGQFEGKPDDLTQNTEYPAVWLLNCNILYKIHRNAELQLTAHNILDSRYVLLQPYYGGHAPVPLLNRQITLGLQWKFAN